MTSLSYAVIYAAAFVFLCACACRALRYARAPIHLRWELYPVPHAEPARAVRGGSRFETYGLPALPFRTRLAGELRYMVPEILFLRALWRLNRPLWYRSFPFHFGLYLLAATAVLLLLWASILIFAPSLIAGTLDEAVRSLYRVAGTAGVILAVLGALGLLERRLNDVNLRPYTTPGDIFNLLFFLTSLTVVAAGYLLRDARSPGVLAFTVGLLTFDTSLRIPPLLGTGILLTSLLTAYVPLTHMSHFIAKYFTFHRVLWDDAPNQPGGRLESRMIEYLTYRPTWAASHLGADGTKSWAELAAPERAAEVKK